MPRAGERNTSQEWEQDRVPVDGHGGTV